MQEMRKVSVSGVIAEFNPLHLGHQKLLDALNTEIKVVVMSGNWVQRGEPAFIDKWTRAQMALAAGADVVAELPFLTAVNGADYFAAGAINLLKILGVEEIVFGTEQGQVNYQDIADIYAGESVQMEAYLASLPAYLPYPIRAQEMWTKFAGISFNGGTPNHILGLAYAKAAGKEGIRLRTIQRDTDYHDSHLTGNTASATAIRQNWQVAKNYLSDQAWELLKLAPKVSWEDFWPLLKYQIRVEEDLTRIYQVNQEMAHRIQAKISLAKSLPDLVDGVVTKRYTRGYIRRALTYILLGIVEAPLPTTVHILGFSQKGQKQLGYARGHLTTKIGQYPWDAATQKADVIYRLGNSHIPEQTYGRYPIQQDRL